MARDIDHKAIYGAGFHAGVMSERGKEMNAEKARRIEDGLTGVEKKIFDAVPISEAWPSNRIVGELRRLGHNIDARTVMACCSKLSGAKLVREPIPGCFQRAAFREKQEHVKLVKPEPFKQEESTVQATPEKKDLLGILGSATAKLREAADEIEEAALAIQAEAQDQGAEAKKLAQLKELLKSALT